MMTLATIFLCYGPGMLSVHGKCFNLTYHPHLRVRRPPCEVTLEYEDDSRNHAKMQRRVLHWNEECVMPREFILGGMGAELLEVRHEGTAYLRERMETTFREEQ